MVSSMDRNFLLSPISMALLISGRASLTASSVGTGGMFSPPAVMINSKTKAALLREAFLGTHSGKYKYENIDKEDRGHI